MSTCQCMSTRQRTSTHVNTRQHTSSHVNTCQHMSTPHKHLRNGCENHTIVSCYIMLYHVISCYIMLYHVISCYILFTVSCYIHLLICEGVQSCFSTVWPKSQLQSLANRKFRHCDNIMTASRMCGQGSGQFRGQGFGCDRIAQDISRHSWIIYEWSMNDLWMIYEWSMNDLWMIYEWSMNDLASRSSSCHHESLECAPGWSCPQAMQLHIFVNSNQVEVSTVEVAGPIWVAIVVRKSIFNINLYKYNILRHQLAAYCRSPSWRPIPCEVFLCFSAQQQIWSEAKHRGGSLVIEYTRFQGNGKLLTSLDTLRLRDVDSEWFWWIWCRNGHIMWHWSTKILWETVARAQ